MPPGASQILGVEFSGHVAELGADATQWKVNDEVFGLASGVCFTYMNPNLDQIAHSHAGRIRGVHDRATKPRHAKASASFLDSGRVYSRELVDRYFRAPYLR